MNVNATGVPRQQGQARPNCWRTNLRRCSYRDEKKSRERGSFMGSVAPYFMEDTYR